MQSEGLLQVYVMESSSDVPGQARRWFVDSAVRFEQVVVQVWLQQLYVVGLSRPRLVVLGMAIALLERA
jgi:hypothetical protein